jgi:hypothetical protein
MVKRALAFREHAWKAISTARLKTGAFTDQ